MQYGLIYETFNMAVCLSTIGSLSRISVKFRSLLYYVISYVRDKLKFVFVYSNFTCDVPMYSIRT